MCPWCNTRRMVETAAPLAEHVLPSWPVRQWVLSVPKRLRYFLHRDAAVPGAFLRIMLRVVAGRGAVAFSHRFGASLNAPVHMACGILDGVFEPAGDNAASGLAAPALRSGASAPTRSRASGLRLPQARPRRVQRSGAHAAGVARQACRTGAATAGNDPPWEPAAQAVPEVEFDQRLAW